MNTYVAIDVGDTQLWVAIYPDEGTTPKRQQRIFTRGKGTASAQHVTEKIALDNSIHLIKKCALLREGNKRSCSPRRYPYQGLIARAYIDQAVADFFHILNPSIVYLGGGVVRSVNLLLRPLKKAFIEIFLSPVYLKNLTITTAALDDDTRLYGTLALVRSL